MRTTALAVLFLTSAVAVAQTTRSVPAQFATIQAAIAASVNGDTVLVAPGIYSGPINFLGKAVTVTSSGGASVTTISGTSAGRVVTFGTNETSASVLSGFTIKDGNGGILCLRSSPTIQNCVVTNNISPSTNGGGLRILADLNGSNASPSVSNCTFSNNFAGSNGGGGVAVECYNGGTSTTSFLNCAMTSNFVLSGGGGMTLIGSGVATTTLTNCLINQNGAASTGGGISFDHFSTATLVKCRILDNVAASGGGGGIRIFAFSGGNTNLVNCVISGNSASADGGGIWMQHSNSSQFLKIQNCTITDNSSPANGGLFVLGGGTETVVGSIVFGNSLPNIGGNTFGSVTATHSCIQPPTFVILGPTNITSDPRFIDPANGDFHLAANSPCIGTGSVGTLPTTTTDFDGSPRIVGTIDMGADEVPVLNLPGTGDDLELYTWIDGGGDPLASSHSASAGTTVTFTMKSPGGTLNGALPLLAGEFFMPAFPPIGLVTYPYVHLDAGLAFLIAGSFDASPFTSPGLDPNGITITTLVPPGLGGFGVRLQGFVVTPFVNNGLFAVSNAHDILF